MPALGRRPDHGLAVEGEGPGASDYRRAGLDELAETFRVVQRDNCDRRIATHV